jgi:hypothetical protein
MMKLFTAALLLVSLVFLAHGGEALYHVAANRQPATVTCNQFFRQRPSALWLRVTGCDIDYLGAGYRESNGRLDELFLPIRPPSQPPTSPVALVVATNDPQALAIAGTTIGNNQQPDQDAYVGMMRRIVTMLRASTEVEGFARSGFIERLQSRRALGGLTVPLVPDFVVLDLHARPSFVRPGIEAGIGLGLLLAAITWLRARARGAAVPTEELPAGGGVGGEPPIARPSRRLPSMMLLNLGPSASVSELESAPPLGPRDEVGGRIGGILGTTEAAQDGRVTVGGAGWSLAFDLGQEDPVWTITVEALGGDGSIDALERLARKTGWRIFAPKLGTFVDPSALKEVQPP